MNTYTFRPHTRHFIALVARGRLAEAKDLLGSRPSIVSDRNSTGETALHWLAIEDELDGVQLLLQHGAEPNCADVGGDFPLGDAASLGLPEIVQALLRAGAEVEARHPLNEETALHQAARQARVPRIADLLIDAGASVDARNHLEETPLHEAASFNNLAFAKRLIARGADCNAVDGFGRSVADRTPEESRAAWADLLQSKP